MGYRDNNRWSILLILTQIISIITKLSQELMIILLERIGGRRRLKGWEGEVALVTGGSQGIGMELAKLMLARGIDRVIIVDIRSPTWIQPVAAGDERVLFFKCDVTDRQEIDHVKVELDSMVIFRAWPACVARLYCLEYQTYCFI